MVKTVTNNFEYQNLWKAKELSLLQSWEWGEIKSGEWNPVRLIVSNVPVTIFTRKFPVLKKSFGYIPRGFSNETISAAVLQELVEFARDRLKLTHLTIDPDITQKEKLDLFEKVGAVSTGKTIQPNQTSFLDLTKTEDELWMNLRATYRRNIKKAVREGFKVEGYDNGEESVDRFYSIMKEILGRKKFGSYTSGYYGKIFDLLSKSNMAKIYIVTKDGEDLASYFLGYTENQAYELYGGVREKAKNMRVGHLLKWETIKDAKKMGKTLYDQWGVAPRVGEEYVQTDELYHVAIFKEGFGGTYTEFLTQQTFIFDKVSFSLYNFAKDLNKFRVSLRKKI